MREREEKLKTETKNRKIDLQISSYKMKTQKVVYKLK